MANYKGNSSTVGTKTGIISRTLMQIDGAEGEVHRTGMFKRKEKAFQRDQGDDRREPPAPPSLPEINTDDGGTTGIVHLDSEGNDPADRESHPRR